MMKTHASLERSMAAVAFAAAVVLGVIALVQVRTGVAQEPYEVVRAAGAVATSLRRDGGVLAAVLALDTIFVALYGTYFTMLACWCRGRAARLARVALAAMLAVAALDLVENAHITTMIRAVGAASAPSTAEIALQSTASHLKFALSYCSLFVFGFCFPRETPLERFVVAGFWVLQLPLGVLCHALPPDRAAPVVVARLAFYLVGFVAAAVVFARRGRLSTLLPVAAR